MEAYRIALGPTADTMWTDLALLCEDRGGSWTDEEAVEMEAKILVRPNPALKLTKFLSNKFLAMESYLVLDDTPSLSGALDPSFTDSELHAVGNNVPTNSQQETQDQTIRRERSCPAASSEGADDAHHGRELRETIRSIVGVI